MDNVVFEVDGVGFVQHALNRSRFRRISMREILETINQPDHGRRGRGNKFVFIRYFGNRRIKVVFCIEDGRQVVVSVSDRDMPEMGLAA